MRLLYAFCICSVLAGCATEPPVPVQSVSIKSSDFCELVDKRRDLTWSINDTRETVTNLRRLGAKHDARCGNRIK